MLNSLKIILALDLTRTKLLIFHFSAKPDPPTIVSATARNNDVILIWRDQFDANTSITQYIVEYRSSSGMMEDLLCYL